MKDLGNLETWTKVQMARVIAQHLMGMDRVPTADNPTVRQMVKNHRKEQLIDLCELALGPRGTK